MTIRELKECINDLPDDLVIVLEEKEDVAGHIWIYHSLEMTGYSLVTNKVFFEAGRQV